GGGTHGCRRLRGERVLGELFKRSRRWGHHSLLWRFRGWLGGRWRRARLSWRYGGGGATRRRRLVFHVKQCGQRVENLLATATTHPALGDLQLVFDDLEDRAAVGASCCQAHKPEFMPLFRQVFAPS